MNSLPDSATCSPRSPRRVLLVDDNEDSAELTRMYAEMRGHMTRVAYDSHSALAAADEFRPDVCLVDLHLGDDSGFILAQQLRAIPGLEHCRLVAVSGLPRGASEAGAEAAGIRFHRHITKPFEREEVLAAIEGEDSNVTGSAAV
ncbi:MAG: response regulator [Myxococcales bacterium]